MKLRSGLLRRLRISQWWAVFLALACGLSLLAGWAQAKPPTASAKLTLLQLHPAQVGCQPSGVLPEDLQASPMPVGGKPLRVTVQLHIDEIPEISSTQNNFLINGFLDVAWCDSRLAADLLPHEQERAYANDGAVDFLKTHWDPQITFTNELGVSEGDDLALLVHRNGVVEVSRRTQVKLQSNFDLLRFPFDRQTLEADIESFAWDDKIVGFAQQSSITLSSRFDIPDWKLKGVQVDIASFKDPDHGSRSFSRIHAGIKVQRKSEFYLYKIFMPLAILTFTSIFFLAIPIDAMGDRVGFVSGLLFTNLAYQLIISSSVPRVPYFTLGDRYTLFLFFFMVSEVFIAYGISLVARFEISRKGIAVNQVERGFEIALPIVFVFVNIYFLFQLH